MTTPAQPDPAAQLRAAAETINVVKANMNILAMLPDDVPRDLTFEQATAVNQVMALNAIAASLLAVADAIARQTPQPAESGRHWHWFGFATNRVADRLLAARTTR